MLISPRGSLLDGRIGAKLEKPFEKQGQVGHEARLRCGPRYQNYGGY